MLEIGVQTKSVVTDDNPEIGFQMLKKAGFTCCDFSLNSYLYNKDIYAENLNGFFSKDLSKLYEYFEPHKKAARNAGIRINQMHMPYPVYVHTASEEVNKYLWENIPMKSMEICKFLECPNIVIHGLKLEQYLGTEEAEWEKTAEFLNKIAPFAAINNITICMENLYEGKPGHLVEGPGCDVRKAVARIDKFNSRYGADVLGFCFDIGHANIVHLDFYDFITTLGPRLKVLHLHDNDGVYDLHQIPFTFTRTRENTSATNWEGFIQALHDIKFEGVLSFETAPVLDSFPTEMKEDVLSFIHKIGKYLAEKI
ncbi:sugar phosphate isomerase/epimerase family protein [Pseudobutyrivibrio sp. MD2005]|uniref:sugar phosphate isomerase/epimerase family protein n=1 Tax=Pseudobutyrivibrio sp. MD2005 TaxID=1410616 RepID=UPI0004866329|nr:sugar phosphate isomerase/epimerase [Pseudobutyrivibrio sp. MD2005]